MSEPPQLGQDERAELERLRAEVAALRAGHRGAAPPPGAEQVARPGRWRAGASALLIVVGCVLLIPATAAVWLRAEVTDTDRYVDTVAPLAREPAVQQAVTTRITNEIFTRIDVAQIVDDTAQALAERGVRPAVTTSLQGLSQPIAGGVQDWVRGEVGKVVASDAFADAWTEANRVAHDSVLAMLTGERSATGLEVQGDTVTINLEPFIAEVQRALVNAGFSLAERIPAVDAEFVLFRSSGITDAQDAVELVDQLGIVLPVVAVVCLIAGVAVARQRRLAVIGTGIGMALAMLTLGAALTVLRPVYLDALPPDVNRAAAEAVFDQVVTFLRTTLRTVLAVGLILALVAYLTGRSGGAVAVRRGVARLGAWVSERDWRMGPVPAWLNEHKRPVQVAIVILAALVFLFWNYPTAGVVLSIAVVAAVLVVLVELLGTQPVGRVSC
ncbi:hypothetical protein [Jiangella asiatica]|uniref:Integral membrane protein n=1 Tax=Jiangella asiatica TaxID=2530372 RepID=A0A4R5D576_9ACTN|nr:hypothetical protein [Jiangella asiatica]TDE08609.1 hypothetical protein E1269_16935 [Jiangella asiatica]